MEQPLSNKEKLDSSSRVECSTIIPTLMCKNKAQHTENPYVYLTNNMRVTSPFCCVKLLYNIH